VIGFVIGRRSLRNASAAPPRPSRSSTCATLAPARAGQVDAVEAHALVEAERAAQVEPHDPDRGRLRRQPQRQLAAHERPQAEDRYDARSARRHRR
jgi:hypothetical protein